MSFLPLFGGNQFHGFYSLWPLALTKGPDPLLSINALYASFPCNQKKAVPENIDAGIQETIRIYFGASFLSELLPKSGG